ncbi:MAG: hypothetical protein JSS81_28735 [Acidobacteria bacterium]|nr:hypothetical protein [Acidobacteriota bacterium]
MSFIILMAVILIVFLTAAVWMFRWQYGKADAMLADWARENDYQILEKQTDDSASGPMGVYRGNRQIVFHVRLRDAAGTERRATVICGSPTTGVLDDSVEVRWEK